MCKYDNFQRTFSPHTDGSDYRGFAGLEFTFDSVTRAVDVPVPLIDDDTVELTESFGASLAFPGAPPPGVTLSPDTALVTILDRPQPTSKHTIFSALTSTINY